MSLFGPTPIPEPQKDSYFRPDTLKIVTDLKSVIDSLTVMLAQPGLHPRAQADLQAAKDNLARASLALHHAGNL